MQKLQSLQRAGTVTSWQHQCFEWQSDAAMQANSEMGCILPTQPCLHLRTHVEPRWHTVHEQLADVCLF